MRQLPPPPLVSRPAIPDTRVDRPPALVVDPAVGPSFTVNALRVTGMTVFPESRLLAVTGFQPGATLGLGELRALAGKITDF